jgi:hypothetical protein
LAAWRIRIKAKQLRLAAVSRDSLRQARCDIALGGLMIGHAT